MIIDIDGCRGNGTEEIFSGKSGISFISLHVKNIYPGTGNETRGNCINKSLPLNCGEEVYLPALDEALEDIDMQEIDVAAVSAGFDGQSR